MTSVKRRLCAFAVIYGASVLALLAVTTTLELLLRLLR